MIRKLSLALAVSVALVGSAFAQASFTAKDGNNVIRTFKSFSCSGMICSLAVPADANGNAFGVSANPFYMAFGAGVTLPGFAAAPSFKLQDGSGNAIGSTSGSLNVNITGGGGGGGGNVNLTQILGAAPSATNPLWIQPGTGASFAVTGTFWQATQPVSIASMPSTPVTGTFWQATQPVSAVSLPLPALAATSTKQSDGTQKTQIVDGAGNVIASTSNNLNVQCANCSGSGVSTADGASFAAGSSLFAGAGGIFQNTPTNNPVADGKQGLFQMTANRAQHVNLRSAAGVELGVAAAPVQVSLANTAANGTALLVTGTGGTFPVTGSFWPYSLGQQLAASSVPVILPAATIATLTPPAAITNFSLETGGNLAGILTTLGAVSASPTANTVQDRLKTVGANTVALGVGTETTCPASGATTLIGCIRAVATLAAAPLPGQVSFGVNIGAAQLLDSNSKTALLDPCEYGAHVWTRIDVATAASSVLVPGTSSKKTYICSIGLMAAGTTNLGIVEGSGTTCGTSPLGLIGGNTAAKGLNLTAQAGVAFGNGAKAIAASTVNANDICLINGSAIQVSGYIVTATP